MEPEPQSFKAFVTAAILVAMLLNLTLLLPVSPVRAESEGQTCTSCSCCQRPRVAETFHHVTVNIVDEEILMQIEPLILPETSCGSCNSGCQNSSQLTNVQFTALEQEENRTVTLATYEFRNGTTVESTFTLTLLWSYSALTDGINRTARFISTEITREDSSVQFYSLSYSVHGSEYNMTLRTELSSLNSEVYGSSFTIMSYMPAQNPDVTSIEFVEINSSVTLSRLYAVLGDVAKKMGKFYESSGNETIAQLAQNYYNMRGEAKNLSKLVEQQLSQYNHEILRSSAVIRDMLCYGGEKCDGGGGPPPNPCTTQCWISVFLGCNVGLPPFELACLAGCAIGALACVPFYPVCVSACFPVCGIIGDIVMIACAIYALGYCCL